MDTLPRKSSSPVTPLTVADRCDRCGARAYVRATLPSGSQLLFCGHHGGDLRASLLGQGAELHDETEALSAKAVSASRESAA